MHKKQIVIGSVVAIAAITALTTNIVSTPFELFRGWLSAAAPTLGSEVLVKLPYGCPGRSEVHISRVVSGTNVIMNCPNDN